MPAGRPLLLMTPAVTITPLELAAEVVDRIREVAAEVARILAAGEEAVAIRNNWDDRCPWCDARLRSHDDFEDHRRIHTAEEKKSSNPLDSEEGEK